jgi:F-type H+-transporting ATPase subunit gamma
MSSLREIKGHISSVRSIAKVTRALGMVAAAKSRRLQGQMERTRPYAEKAWHVLQHLAASSSDVHRETYFYGHGETRRLGLLVITSDRGMVGAYNNSVIEVVNRYLRLRELPTEILTIGRLGYNALLRQGHTMGPLQASLELPASSHAGAVDMAGLAALSDTMLEGFQSGAYDEVAIAYTQFAAGVRWQPTVRTLLPIAAEAAATQREFIYEPEVSELVAALVPRLLRFQIYQVYLEALVAEHTARMVAMRTATHNGNELIDKLTTQHNKARQEAITTEIMDIVGGASSVNAARP